MTYHSSNAFEFGDEITDEIIEEIVSGLNDNKEFNFNETGEDCYTPGAYWIGSTIDACIDNISALLDAHKNKIIPQDKYVEFMKESPKEADILIRKILEKIGYKIA